MEGNGTSGDMLSLEDVDFRKVKNGLDENQVIPFINELTRQRDMLLQRQDHLSSLTKLAEKTVAEADRLAEEIKAEVIQQANTEAAGITASAEEQAKNLTEKIRAEAIAQANKEAAAIKTEAEQKSLFMLNSQRKNIQSELKNYVHQTCGQLLTKLENLKQELLKIEADFEQRLSEPTQVASSLPELPPPVAEESSEEKIETIDKFLELIQSTTKTETREPEWQIEILPPLDISKIMGILSYLDGLPEVENTDFTPEIESPSIAVFLHEPIPLVQKLEILPEIANVAEITADVAGNNAGLKRIQVTLSGTSDTNNKAANNPNVNTHFTPF